MVDPSEISRSLVIVVAEAEALAISAMTKTTVVMLRL